MIAELEHEVMKLRHLLKRQMVQGQKLEAEALIGAEDGEPVVQLRWDTLMAQMSPAEVRELAMGFLRVAEWAESDARVFALAREAVGDEAAGGLMMMMRRDRPGGDEGGGRVTVSDGS